MFLLRGCGVCGFFFFFSSRRRHTRLQGDWSSDVCRSTSAIELTDVRVVRLADVDLQHVLDEGEGDESVAQWRAGHESLLHRAEVRAGIGDPEFAVNDDTLVLAQRFRLVLTAEDA